VIAACGKWVDLRPEVDPLDAHVRTDPRTAGCSAADAAALEWALRAGERWDEPVLAVTAGPPAAERVLRDAVAAGATRAVRIDLPTSAPSAVVATAIAAVLGPAGVSSVWCGDHSLDRGSGAVPAFLAAELGCAQALGLVDVELDARTGRVTAWRRLDRGRREHVRLDGAGVLSVEGSSARLRRAGLGAVMSSGRAPIEVVAPGPAAREASGAADAHLLRPFRPRARVLPAPAGTTALDRVRALTESTTASSHSHEVVVLDPPAAADRILDALAAWGYRER
jgi:electron transfer flavoprotein beta subunit